MRRHLVTTCLFLALAAAGLPSPGGAQTAADAEAMRARAIERLQAEDWTGAADIFRRLTSSDAATGLDWFRLGFALHQRGDMDDYPEAIEAMRQAAALGAQVPSATFRRARMLAALGRSDRAVAVLDSMAAAGFAQTAIIERQTEFESLKGTPAFEAVLDRTRRNAEPCEYLEGARQLDFWVGDWNVYVPAGAQVGENHIERGLNGCVILENWTSVGGQDGKSFNLYDPVQDTWKQVWTDETNWIVYYTDGHYRDDAMHFEGFTYGAANDTVLIRMDLVNAAPDTVRQVIETSTDRGQSWAQTFVGIYVRKEPTAR